MWYVCISMQYTCPSVSGPMKTDTVGWVEWVFDQDQLPFMSPTGITPWYRIYVYIIYMVYIYIYMVPYSCGDYNIYIYALVWKLGHLKIQWFRTLEPTWTNHFTRFFSVKIGSCRDPCLVLFIPWTSLERAKCVTWRAWGRAALVKIPGDRIST